MIERFYFDTSIWLDFLEKRDEPNLPKGTWAIKLIRRIVNAGDKILFSDNNMLELINLSYLESEIEELLTALESSIIYIEATEKEIGKAKDLAQKRNVPKRDALHALIARDNNALLITLDNHFKELIDIIKPNSPQDFI